MIRETLRKHPLAAVFAFVTVCELPMMIFRDPSPSNELRYLSIVEEALREGHFFCFYNHGIPYTDKPPLFFWLMMFLRLFCGRTCMWLPVLFTALIPSFVTVAVMDRWLRLSSAISSQPGAERGTSRPECPVLQTQVSPLARICAASILLSSLLFAVQTFFLRMDMLMTMFIVLELFTFWKMYIGRDVRKANRWLLPLYIFLALFTKGPVGFFAPVVVIIVFLALEKQFRRLPEFLGWRQWLVMLLLFGGWILGAWLEGGGEYIRSLLFHQTLDRAVNAFTHKQPFWWYIPTLLYAVLPYTLLMITAVVYLYLQQWKKHRANLPESTGSDTLNKLLLTSIAVVFIMLSAFSGKLAIYLTPVLPLMAYLVPAFSTATAGCREGLKKAALMIPSVIIALAGLALWTVYLLKGVEPFSKIAFALAINTPYIFSTTILATAAVLLSGFTAAGIVTARGGWQKGAIAMAAALYLAIFAFGCTVNHVNEWLGYRSVAEEALRQSSGTDTYNTLFVSRPENMDIYLGCDVIDYKDNVEAFISGTPIDGSPSDPYTGDHRGEVLIVPTSRLGDCPPLFEYLESNEGTSIGPFSVFAL
ncbi:MAG: hypothetical protein IKN31_02700 [Bacteroidales bacterium]|nr:hypothetical protein [Bacteroidales bacterium]